MNSHMTHYGGRQIKVVLVDDRGEFEVENALVYEKLRSDRDWRYITLDYNRLGHACNKREEDAGPMRPRY